MTKQNFLDELRKALSGLPKDDVEERLIFYCEMIDDRIEEGLSEEDAVAQIGSVNDIKAQVIAEVPFSKLVKEKIKPKRTLRAWEIVLLILGSPIWVPLCIAALVVLASVYVVIWSVIVALWSVEVALAGSSLGGVVAAVIFICRGYALNGIATLGAGLCCAGLSVFLFFGCQKATYGILLLTKKAFFALKSWFVKKEETK